MADEVLQMLNARSQLMRNQIQSKRDRTPIRTKKRPALALRQKKLSKTQTNMMPQENWNFDLPKIPARPDYAKTGLLEKQMLEVENKVRLERDRQRIRAQVQSYKLPQLMPEEFSDNQMMQVAQDEFEQEYLQQIQSKEFEQAAMQKIDSGVNQEEARTRQKQLKRAQETATSKAKDATKEVIESLKKVQAAGKVGWDTENIMSLVDAVEPADLEIPSIFTIIVQMYRACTALLNNGEKFIKGPLAFIEPEPLYRFWSPDAAQKLVSSGTSDIFSGGTELENTIESMTLGWPEAIIGFQVIIYLLLSILAVIIPIILIFLIGGFVIGGII